MNRSKLSSFVRNAEDAPTLPGAYVLIVELAESIQITLPRKPKTTRRLGAIFIAARPRDREVFARACRGTCDLTR